MPIDMTYPQALLTAKEAAQMLAVKTKTINDWARKGKIPFVLIGITRRYVVRDLAAWIEAQKVVPIVREVT